MAFIALGINHKTASVDVRERVAFTPEQLVEALQQLCRITPSREAAMEVSDQAAQLNTLARQFWDRRIPQAKNQ